MVAASKELDELAVETAIMKESYGLCMPFEKDNVRDIALQAWINGWNDNSFNCWGEKLLNVTQKEVKECIDKLTEIRHFPNEWWWLEDEMRP